jgi:hypothetical protein
MLADKNQLFNLVFPSSEPEKMKEFTEYSLSWTILWQNFVMLPEI